MNLYDYGFYDANEDLHIDAAIERSIIASYYCCYWKFFFEELEVRS